MQEHEFVVEGDRVADKYVVGRLLGRGGMGIVREARDIRVDRRVAIKFLLPSVATPDFVKRFMREARAATRISSEHVVRLLEADALPNGAPYLVMEHLEGEDLNVLLREQGPLPPKRAVDLLLQALQAVAEGHMRGVIHRDLKPSNLFLTQRADGSPLIKVLDFGIAKVLPDEGVDTNQQLTSSNDALLGSPAYMSPEQLLSPREVDRRSDIWSIGVTLYEMLCGTLPYKGDNKLALVAEIAQREGGVVGRNPEANALPRGLVQIIERCLKRNPDERYASIHDLALALAPYGGEEASLSLRRISGLMSDTTANAVRSGSRRDSAKECAATLPPSYVQSLPGFAMRTWRSRTLLLASIAAGLSVAVVVKWKSSPRTPLESMPASSRRTTTRVVEPSVSVQSNMPTVAPLPVLPTSTRFLPFERRFEAHPPKARAVPVTARSSPMIVRDAPKPSKTPLREAPAGSATPATPSSEPRAFDIQTLIQQRH